MFICFQSCKGFGGISEPLWHGGRDGQARPAVIPLALLQWAGCGEWGFVWVSCGHKGSGTQGSRAFHLRHFHPHSSKAGLASPCVFSWDFCYFFFSGKNPHWSAWALTEGWEASFGTCGFWQLVLEPMLGQEAVLALEDRQEQQRWQGKQNRYLLSFHKAT